MFLLAVGVAAQAADERIQVGPLRLDVYISRTAALFHVVDQLSEWSYYSHRQYGRAFSPLTDADRAMLAKHKAVRAKHPWGEGLEQTFYAPLPLEEALREGMKQGWLTSDEAATEREVLSCFAARVDALFTAQASALAAFRERMRHELSLRAPVIANLARFTGNTPDPIPVYLLPDPDAQNHGGGFNGGRLTIEVPTEADAVPTALHELFHAFIDPSKSQIEAAANGVPGLNEETLNEGLAYALSPGIIHGGPAAEDSLAKAVGADFVAGKSLTDPYTRFRRFGLALRPLLKDALADDRQTLTAFLPRAVDVWRALQEVELGRGAALSGQPELKTVTIIGLYGPDAPELPAWVKENNARRARPTRLFIACKEWVAGTYLQMRTFSDRASHEFLLVTPGHPDIKARLNGNTVSSGDGGFQAYGLEILAEDQPNVTPGATYSIKPINSSDTYRWQVAEGLAPVKLMD